MVGRATVSGENTQDTRWKGDVRGSTALAPVGPHPLSLHHPCRGRTGRPGERRGGERRETAQAAGLLPGEVDTRDRLATKLPEINVDGVALDEVIDFFRDFSGLNVFVDWPALSGLNRMRREGSCSEHSCAPGDEQGAGVGGGGGKKKRADAVGGVVVVSTPKRIETIRAHFRRLKGTDVAGKIGEQLRQPVPEVNSTAHRSRTSGFPPGRHREHLRRLERIGEGEGRPPAPVNLRLKNVPLNQTLRPILDRAGGNKAVLDFKVEGNTITVSARRGRGKPPA